MKQSIPAKPSKARNIDPASHEIVGKEKAHRLDRPQITLKTHLLVIAIYFLLTLGFAWTILPNLGKVTPGELPLDRNQYLWSFWWVKHALFDLGTNPFRSDLLFYPYGVSLSLHAYSPLNVFLSLPLQFVLGTISTYTIVGLVSFPLGAYTGFLLAHYLTEQVEASFCAGLLFSFTAFHYSELRNEHLYLTSTWWIPLFVLFFLKTTRAKSLPDIMRNGLLAGFFLVLVGLNDYYYLTYLLLFTLTYWIWHSVKVLWPALRQRIYWKTAATSFVTITIQTTISWFVCLVGLSYMLWNLINDIRSGIFTQVSVSGQELDGSSDLLAIWFPPGINPFWGQKLDLWNNMGITLSKGPTVGWVGLILSVLALFWRLREARPWMLAAIGWTILALGPSLSFNGQNTLFPLPHRLLQEIPPFNMGRYPERYMVMTNLSLAIVGAYVLVVLFKTLSASKRNITLALLIIPVLIYLETWPGFLPVPNQIGPFPFTQYIQADNGLIPKNQAILELPVTKHWTSDSYRMLYQMYHARPILGGYISRKVEDLYRFGPPNPWPLYDFLEVRGFGTDIIPTHTREEWLGLLNYGNFGYIVVYPGEFDTRGQLQQIYQLLEAVFTPPVKPDFEDQTALVYKVQTGGSLRKPVMILGWGWHQVEKVDNQKVQRWINLDRKGEGQILILNTPDVQTKQSYSLDFEASAYLKARHLDVLLNGFSVGRIKVEGLQSFHLEGLKLQTGVNVLSFRPDPAEGYDVPSQVSSRAANNDTRQLTISLLSVKLS